MTSNKKPVGDGKELLVKHIDPGIGQYANHLIVQKDQNAYILTFYQLNPPILVGSNEEKEDQLSNIDEIEAHPVGRIIVSNSAYGRFVKALAALVKSPETKETHK